MTRSILHTPADGYPPLQEFALLHERLLASIQADHDGMSYAAQQSFAQRIDPARLTYGSIRGKIHPAEPASIALHKAMCAMREECMDCAAALPEKDRKLYESLQAREYQKYRGNTFSLLQKMRPWVNSRDAMPPELITQLKDIALQSVRERVKESVTESFPNRPGFIHLDAPAEHLAFAKVLPDADMLATARENLMYAYVMDLGYSYENAAAHAEKQEEFIDRQIASRNLHIASGASFTLRNQSAPAPNRQK